MSRRTILTIAVAALGLFAGNALAQRIVPSPLLSIDQNRATVVERIVGQWGDRLVSSTTGISSAQLREILFGLRADHLLAASLAGSVEGLRDVVSGALVHTDAVVSPALMHTKALGDTNDDLVYTPVVPCRILDTRNGTTPPYNAQMVGGSAFPVAANLANFAPQGGSATSCNLPASFAAIAVTLTVLNPNFDAFLAASNSSNFAILTQSVVMDFSANKGLANTAIVPVDGTVKFYLGMPASVTTHVIADAVGYFRGPNGNGGQFFKQGGNAFGAPAMIGTTDAQPVTVISGGGSIALDVGNGNGLRVVQTTGNSADAPNVVNGSTNNSAAGQGVTVAGGGYAGSNCGNPQGPCSNRALADISTVGGGAANLASNVGATVGGGGNNTSSGPFSTVAGGLSNTASGPGSTVAGGGGNIASGQGSFAAGQNATADAAGCFVWNDGSGGEITCGGTSAVNRVVMHAAGGYIFFSNASNSSGVQVAPGAGAWSVISDRGVKDHLRPVDGRWVLQQLAAMPIATWNWKSQDVGIRHMGPMAQDFSAAFGLGEDDKHISTVDADGVALAAIQGLHQLVVEKDSELRRQDRKISTLEKELAAIKTKLGLE